MPGRAGPMTRRVATPVPPFPGTPDVLPGGTGAMASPRPGPSAGLTSPPTVDPGTAASGGPSASLVLLAFLAVYLVWGSTYLAIRIAIETLPPLLMAGTRFLVAGALLYGWTRARGAPRPTALQWGWAVLVGGLLLVFGNGGVVLAEQWVPSGLVALLVSAVPLWMVLLDWLSGRGERPSPRVAAGVAVGFGGVALLVGSEGVGAGGRAELAGGLLVLAAAFFWAVGSLASRYAPAPSRPGMWIATQMIGGGGLLLSAGLLAGEAPGLEVAAVSARSLLALGYLVVFGSLVGFSAYVWLLRVSTPARVATYAYVNPVVALVLGWAVAGEPLTFRSLAAAAIIIGAVVVITTERARGGGRPGPDPSNPRRRR